ncbi:hypothetical protein MSAN_00040900 [Mycena sanguinolenta]|uniref:Uncharacterized protein n=1 Tax=Mycena sanguinolenta TaxID=230812 RepID=A0A8H7DM46_9AGAR|nr:hypothetical protein MSAN_00040900 [Mycena sanguinolenta]
MYSEYTRAFPESYCRADPLPSYPPKPCPPRVPTPDYIDIHHHSVRTFIDTLYNLASWNSNYIPPCTETAFALTAIGVLRDYTNPLHKVFWATNRRIDTATRVQRVIESGQYLCIPAPWSSARDALRTLTEREEACRAAVERRNRALAQASASKTAPSPQKTQTQAPRVTRAAAARQTQQQQQTTEVPAAADVDAKPSTSDRKRRRSPLVEAAPAPQRTSARQQKKRAQEEASEDIPPAVVASTAARPPRARSASQESNETLVASTSTSSSSTSPLSSRAASVSSADTVVDVEVDVVSSSSKGKGRLVASAPAPSPPDAAAVSPIDPEAGMVTRSRTRKTSPQTNSARATPYPATKDAQLAAGRGQSTNKRAPTGKRKVAKPKAK